MNTRQQAKGRWEVIYSHWGIPYTPKLNKHYECPLCGKKDFRVTDYKRGGECVCTCFGSIDGVNLGMRMYDLSFSDTCKAIDEIIGREYQKPEGRQVDSSATKQAKAQRAIMLRAKPIKGSQAQAYLNSRQVWRDYDNIYFVEAARYGKDSTLPAMMAVMTDCSGRIEKVHFTYLNCGKKADGLSRLAYNIEDYTSSTSAVRLSNHNGVLAVGEGIETCQAYSEITKIPAWSRLNAGLLKSFIAPKGVKRLYVIADCDESGTGQAASWHCARANVLSNNDVDEAIVSIPLEYGDFCDIRAGIISPEYSQDKLFKKRQK